MWHRIQDTGRRRRAALTIVELLVVVAVIGLLIALLLPALGKAKDAAYLTACESNLRQVHLAAANYASANLQWFPVEPTEHNPHPGLMAALLDYAPSMTSAFYCPQAFVEEPFAQNATAYVPIGATDSIINTEANRNAGRIGYLWWSFSGNKTGIGGPWRETANFFPRHLTTDSAVAVNPSTPPANVGPDERWLVCDFFRRGAPFPHSRQHATGVDVGYVDGHVGLVTGSPKFAYR